MLELVLIIIRITLIITFIYFAKKLLKTIIRKIIYRIKKTSISVGDDLNVYAEESQIPSIFVGIVDGPELNSISIGIINVNKQTVSYKSFPLIETSLVETRSLLNEDKPISELEAIVDFLRYQILESKNAQVLMEIPSAVLDINSLYLKILLLLSRKGYCGLEVKLLEENKRVQLGFHYVLSYDQGEIPWLPDRSKRKPVSEGLKIKR